VAQVGPSLQDQIDALRQALTNLQSTSTADLNALKNQITALQQALSNLQSQAAMQSTALLSTGLEVVIIVLLALVLYMQVRKPKNPRPVIMAPQAGSARSGPPSPEEEL
jgi:predicted PurR-regulated permease PerM